MSKRLVNNNFMDKEITIYDLAKNIGRFLRNRNRSLNSHLLHKPKNQGKVNLKAMNWLQNQ